MITLLVGENSYEIEQALGRLVADFDGEAEKLDGAELELRQLPDLLAGQSLFAEKRLVVARGLAGNKPAWEALPDLLGRISDDIHLVLIESAPDKRTRAYKALQKAADAKELQLWGERDSGKAERWAKEVAAAKGLRMDAAAARELVQRSLAMTEKGQPYIDQWQIAHSIDKLLGFGDATVELVEKYIDEQPIDNVFSLFETALMGKREELHRLLATIEAQEDPFRVFALLSSQVVQLAALVASGQPAPEIAKAVGAHPFALSKLGPHVKGLTKAQASEMVRVFAEADKAMKSSKGTPWVLIEQALMKAATIAKVH